jgi:hypothetical protein
VTTYALAVAMFVLATCVCIRLKTLIFNQQTPACRIADVVLIVFYGFALYGVGAMWVAL